MVARTCPRTGGIAIGCAQWQARERAMEHVARYDRRRRLCNRHALPKSGVIWERFGRHSGKTTYKEPAHALA